MKAWRAAVLVGGVAFLIAIGFSRSARADFCSGGAPPACKDKCCGGNDGTSTTEGDPVDYAGGNTLFSNVDVSLPTAFGPLTFARVYGSAGGGNTEFRQEAYSVADFPFGQSMATNTARWTHNWWAFVSVALYGNAYVHDSTGYLDYFYCPAGLGQCTYGNADSRNRLERVDGGFIYYQDGKGRLAFNARWTGDSTFDVYFLSDVYSTNHHLATITYAQPSDPKCRVADAGSAPGVPYIASIRSDDGYGFALDYAPHLTRYNTNECTITALKVLPPQADAGTVTAVTYTYQPADPNTPAFPVSATFIGAGGGGADLLEQYAYTGPSFASFSLSRASSPIVTHTQGGPNQSPGDSTSVVLSVEPDGRRAFEYYPAAVPGMQHPRTVDFLESQPGDGNPPPVDAGVLRRTYDVQAIQSQMPGARVVAAQDSCSAGAACSPGLKSFVWAPTSGSIHEYEQAVGDKRGNWRVRLRTAGQNPAQSELQWVLLGATDQDGGTALDRTQYSYSYNSQGEQNLQSSFRDSVLGPLNSASETRRTYDSNSNQLTKSIQHGWTTVFDGTTWTTQERYIGTFYFTNHACLGDAADTLSRVVETHGPCLVSGFNAADCDGGGAVPITQSFYWPLTDTALRAGKLQKTVRFTNTNSTSCTAATSLTTTYSAYDVRGNATSVTDPNGVVTTLAYEEDRVTSSTTAGLTTGYTYDTRKLAAIKFPQGNYEVFCYRTGTPGVGCSGGTWTPRLQWKGKSAVADGSTWSERVVYTYWGDGTLSSETYRGACSSGCGATSGELRRVVKHAADGHRRPVLDQSGDATGSFTSVRFFDRADNLAGIGFAYNGAPSFCGGAAGTAGSLADTPLSHLCSALGYDRANRVIGLDEYPASGGSATRSCLAYDAQSNVSSVRTGCPANATPGDCSSCSAPASTYQYDDFGNVTAATLPWTDNGSGAAGTTRYTYDAVGHLLQKQTPAMAQTSDYLTYAYDSLGRTLSLTHHYTQPSSGNELLFTFAYDSSATLDASCPQPTNTKGRMLYRNDSFGTTWFRYDSLGRVLQEVRLRTATSTCSASTPNLNPHTTYTYSNNGNLTSVVYPYGRTVTYGYGSGALADRVSTVSVTSWNGTSWVAQSNLISAVAWEPYGRLRGYQIKHPTTATTSAVEYFLGDNGSVTPSSACPTSVPSTGGSDHTGRVRALWVSTGNFSPGTGNGATYKRTYTWQGDQLKQEDTCLLGATTASTVTYAYDQLLRLTSAGRPGGNFAAAGGSIGTRAYGFDGRGNRTSETREDCSYSPTYGQSGFPDRLTRQASSCAGAILKYDYAYDRDGRVSSKKWPLDSTGDAGTAMLLASGGTASGTNGALDTVFKSATINGAVYNYYYDALNRRRLKVYPAGPMDEAFHDMASELLVDQGNDAVLTPTTFPVDEYVWLGGRPVMLVRSKLSTTWVRQTDSTGDCTRNGDPAACGFYFPVADFIGKPVLMLDASRRVSGAAEYDAFGFPNRVSLDKETAHPYANNSNLAMADFTQSVGGTANPSTQIRVRAIFDLVDTEGPVASPADYIFLKDPDGGVALTSNIGGPHRGQVWSPWVVPSAGRIQVPFISNATGNTYTGVVMAGYEYQRFQTGAQSFWMPLGFPGQYHDAETDLFQNWNRFYDAAIGRYLESEPRHRTAEYTSLLLRDARVAPTYAYGLNNPLDEIDPTGLETTRHSCTLNLDADCAPPPRCTLSASGSANAASIAENEYDLFDTCKKLGAKNTQYMIISYGPAGRHLDCYDCLGDEPVACTPPPPSPPVLGGG
jgi:RHS repeat-associated protein